MVFRTKDKGLDEVEKYVVGWKAFLDAEREFGSTGSDAANSKEFLRKYNYWKKTLAVDPDSIAQALEEHRQLKAPGLSEAEHQAVLWKAISQHHEDSRPYHLPKELREEYHGSSWQIRRHIKEQMYYRAVEDEVYRLQVNDFNHRPPYFLEPFAADQIPKIDQESIRRVTADYEEYKTAKDIFSRMKWKNAPEQRGR